MRTRRLRGDGHKVALRIIVGQSALAIGFDVSGIARGSVPDKNSRTYAIDSIIAVVSSSVVRRGRLIDGNSAGGIERSDIADTDATGTDEDSKHIVGGDVAADDQPDKGGA